jgi:hypothetical protein
MSDDIEDIVIDLTEEVDDDSPMKFHLLVNKVNLLMFQLTIFVISQDICTQ